MTLISVCVILGNAHLWETQDNILAGFQRILHRMFRVVQDKIVWQPLLVQSKNSFPRSLITAVKHFVKSNIQFRYTLIQSSKWNRHGNHSSELNLSLEAFQKCVKTLRITMGVWLYGVCIVKFCSLALNHFCFSYSI